jgi:hypothetical protein
MESSWTTIRPRQDIVGSLDGRYGEPEAVRRESLDMGEVRSSLRTLFCDRHRVLQMLRRRTYDIGEEWTNLGFTTIRPASRHFGKWPAHCACSRKGFIGRLTVPPPTPKRRAICGHDRFSWSRNRTTCCRSNTRRVRPICFPAVRARACPAPIDSDLSSFSAYQAWMAQSSWPMVELIGPVWDFIGITVTPKSASS